MAKEKKVRERVNWNRELKLAPGYLILCLWILFTVVLLGWVVGASFSTTKAIFSGKIMSSGFHLENYAKAWNNSNVSTFFMNSIFSLTVRRASVSSPRSSFIGVCPGVNNTVSSVSKASASWRH